MIQPAQSAVDSRYRMQEILSESYTRLQQKCKPTINPERMRMGSKNLKIVGLSTGRDNRQLSSARSGQVLD
jgi:hypothetical protein